MAEAGQALLVTRRQPQRAPLSFELSPRAPMRALEARVGVAIESRIENVTVIDAVTNPAPVAMTFAQTFEVELRTTLPGMDDTHLGTKEHKHFDLKLGRDTSIRDAPPQRRS